jgi:CHAD domain-containing protein
MAYCFANHESAAHGIARIARERLNSYGRAGRGGPAEERIHQLRKRTALRSLPSDQRARQKTRRGEHACYREVARKLASAREAAVLLRTFDRLVEGFADHFAPEAFAPIRARLAATDRRIGAEVQLAEERRLAASLLSEAHERAAGWQLRKHGFSLIAGGLGDTYRRARTAFSDAYAHNSIEAFHEWRKRSKDHFYHVRLLVPIWPGPLGALEAELDRLTELLGDEHDLADLEATLRSVLLAEPELDSHRQGAGALLVLLDRRRHELRREARALGEILFAERPKSLVRRFRAYFEAWHTYEPTAEPQLEAAGATEPGPGPEHDREQHEHEPEAPSPSDQIAQSARARTP